MGPDRYILFNPQGRISKGGGSRGPFEAGPEALGVNEPSAQVMVEVADLSPREVADAERDPDQAIARSMPLSLIAPIEMAETPLPAGPGSTWGVEAVSADASPFTGAGVKVAVLDTGIDATHEAFTGAVVTQMDFTGEGNGDQHGHGTHCAGTIAGRPVNGFRVGVAPGVPEILAGKVLGAQGGSTEALSQGIEWAVQQGANVISMSLGIDFPGAVDRAVQQHGMTISQATSFALEAYRQNLALFGALTRLMNAQAVSGVAGPAIVVAATGNESERAAAKPYTIAVSPPAASEGFIGVGAVGRGSTGSLTVASFSNTGGKIAGPGVDVLSAKPGGGYQTMSGTSMATPHVAGVAALWAECIQKRMHMLNADTLSAILLANTRFDTAFDFDDVGNGLAQAPQG